MDRPAGDEELRGALSRPLSVEQGGDEADAERDRDDDPIEEL